MKVQIKSLEARCRRAAVRRGYVLKKDGQRDPLGLRFGKWYVYQDGVLKETFANVWDMANWFGYVD